MHVFILIYWKIDVSKKNEHIFSILLPIYLVLMIVARNVIMIQISNVDFRGNIAENDVPVSLPTFDANLH